jgi:glycosyltransferase involved in cell wall biosynthesis
VHAVSGRRILLLSELYPPAIGGMEGHVSALGRALRDRGHDVSVATARLPGTPAYETDDGIRIHRFQGLAARTGVHARADRPYHPPFADPLVTRALHTIVARERPDVVHAHSPVVHSFVPLKRSSRARLVLTLHDYGSVCVLRTLMRDSSPCSGPGLLKCAACASREYGVRKGLLVAGGLRVARPGLAAVDHLVAVSAAVARACRPLGRTIEVIPNFLPLAAVDAGRRVARPAWLPAGPYILYVGALSREKGVPALLRAYERLEAPPPLVLIGTPHPSVPEVTQANVIVRHDVPHAEVMCAWLGATLGTVPSVWPDPCPTTALEAAATGTPLVASRIGGLSDIVVDGETGVLVAPGDEAALAAAFTRLLSDGEARAAMGAAARARSRRFDVDVIAERLERVYGARRPFVKRARTGELARR